MDDRRFDALARAVARRSSRRAAVVGGLAAAAVGLGLGRPRLPGLAQDAASPGASPAASPLASPGPLDLLGGTPAAAGNGLRRLGDVCKGFKATCATDPSIQLGQAVPDAYATDECCSGSCRKYVGRIVVWLCD